ncbi:hypothetical protein HanRHA438_Chr07g0310961 [Helianthus annuus]|nr:hypothetical protein HanRHA438_Chr07g0310961 [Helianthus annuus]
MLMSKICSPSSKWTTLNLLPHPLAPLSHSNLLMARLTLAVHHDGSSLLLKATLCC